jgi:quercetin dioxygenase-like cupin family protein
MIHPKRNLASGRRLAAATAAILAGILIVPSAQATPASGFVGTQIMKGQFGDLKVKLNTSGFDLKLDTRGDSDIYVTRNAIAVDGQSGWHTHPGPSLITVTLGEIVAYDSDLCTPIHYAMGATFVDPGDGHVHLLRNESGAAAETVAVQFVARDAPRRIDAAAPNNCNL